MNTERTIIKGGRLVDPYQGIDETMDIAVEGGTIADCEANLQYSGKDKVVDATGMMVLPGLIDMHTHLAEHLTPGLGINADKFCLCKGTTTAVDAGSTGDLTFVAFRKFVMKRSETNIFAFLNAESLGMIEFPQRETHQKWPDLITERDEMFHEYFVNEGQTVRTIKENRDVIAGVKWAHHGQEVLKKAVRIARKADTRLMVENHFMPDTLRLLSSGDIVTHIFHADFNKVSGRIDGIRDDRGAIHEEILSAQSHGVLLDLGHGGASFSWDVAEQAARQSLFPDIISTDLWKSNVNGPVFDLPTTMTKMLSLGMQFTDVLKAVTATPAMAIGREGIFGTLKTGVSADIVLMRNIDSEKILLDSSGTKRKVDSYLSTSSVFRKGKLVA